MRQPNLEPVAVGPTDLVIRNARVSTLAEPRATAVAVRGDRIAWLGSEDAAGAVIGPRTKVIDAGGRPVIPGFVDSHHHVLLARDPDCVDLANVFTLDEVRHRLKEAAATRPPDTWLEGESLCYLPFPGRSPCAADLDGVADDRPIFVITFDVHSVLLNRAAMRRLAITRESDPLPWGTVQNDPRTGEPSGLITDFAVKGISGAGPTALAATVPRYHPERRRQRMAADLRQALAFGITTVVEPQASLGDLAGLREALAAQPVPPRLEVALHYKPDTGDAELEQFRQTKRAFSDDHFRVGAVKLYIDDVMELRTAALLEPYADDPGNSGHTYWEPEEFAALITRLDSLGLQTYTHAIGDRGVRTVLDAVERARQVNGPRDLRHQVVHAECVAPDDIPRFTTLGVVACMQPRHGAADLAAVEWASRVGSRRLPRAWPLRSLQQAGAVLAFSSDWPVAEMDPFVIIYSALTRASLDGAQTWTPEERLGLAETLRAYTLGSAYAIHAEGNRGRIAPGLYADLIVLSHDLAELSPAEILSQARVELTLVGGRIAHRTGAI